MDEKLISPEYKQLITEKHDHRPWGGTGHSWVSAVLDDLSLLRTKFNREVETILDYGCGRGTFKTKMAQVAPSITVYEYDPGVRGKDDLGLVPAMVDYVVCTDVMEHVEEQFVDETLRTIHGRGCFAVFFNIECNISKSSLPDGRNTHITVKPHEWWSAKLEKIFANWVWTVHERGGRLVISGRAP